jgi:hypothetical protein
MSETVVVVGTFFISYGMIFVYALYLHRRRRKVAGPQVLDQ